MPRRSLTHAFAHSWHFSISPTILYLFQCFFCACFISLLFYQNQAVCGVHMVIKESKLHIFTHVFSRSLKSFLWKLARVFRAKLEQCLNVGYRVSGIDMYTHADTCGYVSRDMCMCNSLHVCGCTRMSTWHMYTCSVLCMHS